MNIKNVLRGVKTALQSSLNNLDLAIRKITNTQKEVESEIPEEWLNPYPDDVEIIVDDGPVLAQEPVFVWPEEEKVYIPPRIKQLKVVGILLLLIMSLIMCVGYALAGTIELVYYFLPAMWILADYLYVTYHRTPTSSYHMLQDVEDE